MLRRSSKRATRTRAPAKLTRYAAKRDFAKTPEPSGRVGARGGSAYLIQKHAATRLHYDFRLELDGVLKSWAVTKGPSLDPADRRLAVHVEDHPVAYGEFEGVIPEGQYGAGTVMVWDRGTWEPVGDPYAGYAAGKLKFVLKGKRLKGGWLLVRMRGRAAQEGRDNWLLIKENDRYARSGNGDALTARLATSAASGKTMPQIAGAKNARVWQAKSSAEPAATIAARKPRPAPRRVANAPDPSPVAGACRGGLPDFVAPQLATLVDAPPKSGDWLHEIKIDGYRAYCRRRGGEVRLLTRTGQDWSDRFQALVPALAAVPGGDFALDGEIAVFDERGISSFGALQAALSAKQGNKLVYIVFDLLYLDGYDLRGAKLIDRKALLAALLTAAPKGGPVRYSEHLHAPGGEVFAHACALALEGIVSKRADRPYVEGRTPDWVKSKCVARQEFVICGYTPPKKSGRTGFASLIIGYYEEEKLRYAGHVGTGFTQETLRDLAVRLTRLRTDQRPIAGPLPVLGRRNAIWVRPELVCEVEFTGWTQDGVLRQPSFQGLREDKPATAVDRERTVAALRRRAAATMARARVRSAAKRPLRPASAAREIAGVAISHPDREVFPDIGVTKEALAEYYRTVADWILPEIADRPLSLLRCPTGTGGQCFFQKHFAAGMKSVERVAIREKDGTTSYLVVHGVHDLVAMIQEGVIEIHPWGARADDPDKPDRIVFDLDPAPDVAFERVIDTACAMRELLAEIDLDAFAKTTGGKGLHVVVPLRRGIGWDRLKAFTHAVAQTFARANTATYTINPAKHARAGKIYIDYLRNDRGSTAVAGYCVRARAGAPVALPLAWSEVKRGLDPHRYSVTNVPRLLETRRDPWRKLYRSRQTIPARAFKSLGID
ncbi:MAG: DNA ligase D [Alphaproteobacteria bacterium]|nr:DNA ligase D [Alphaproteobacteria bacterium]